MTPDKRQQQHLQSLDIPNRLDFMRLVFIPGAHEFASLVTKMVKSPGIKHL